MEGIRIFLVEDDDDIRRSFKRFLEDLGHQVVLEASTLAGALAVIEQGKLQEYQVDVAILDGSLDDSRRGCGDGRTVAKSIKQSMPQVFTIALTSYDEKYADYGDKYVHKLGSTRVLPDVLSAL